MLNIAAKTHFKCAQNKGLLIMSTIEEKTDMNAPDISTKTYIYYPQNQHLFNMDIPTRKSIHRTFLTKNFLLSKKYIMMSVLIILGIIT